jgi:pimeloyl-ACP methyl ester carboxylesterase
MYKTYFDSYGRRTLMRRTDDHNQRLCVFVHGLGQNHLSGWIPLPTFFERTKSTPFTSWDYLFFGYDSRIDADFIGLANLLSSEIYCAINGFSFFENHKYTEFALVGYSLGAIVIRQFIAACAIQRNVTSLKSITLINAPTGGSSLATFGAFIAPFLRRSRKLVNDLRPDSTPLTMLEYWTRCAYSHHQWPSPRIIHGIYDPVVVDFSTRHPWMGDNIPEYISSAHDLCEHLRPPNGRVFEAIRDQLL